MAENDVYVSPNDQVDAEGNITPQAADVIGKRVQALLATVQDPIEYFDPKKVKDYKVYRQWQTGYKQYTHKIGSTVSAKDIEVPEGYTPEDYLKELVMIGVLIPQYDKETEKQMQNTPATITVPQPPTAAQAAAISAANAPNFPPEPEKEDK